jgi:hypothetical protein
MMGIDGSLEMGVVERRGLRAVVGAVAAKVFEGFIVDNQLGNQ